MHDGSIHRQCFSAEFTDGRHCAAGNGTSGRYPHEERAVLSGGCVWRMLCCSSVPARWQKPGKLAGKAYSRYADGADSLWLGTSYPTADTVVFCSVLRTGGVRDGFGNDGWRSSCREWYILYQCGCRRSADCFCCCLYCTDGGISRVSRQPTERFAGACDAGVGRQASAVDCVV